MQKEKETKTYWEQLTEVKHRINTFEDFRKDR